MTLYLPPAHQVIVLGAVRVLALQARLAILTTPANPPTIEFYANPMPDPWDSGLPDPAPTPVATMTMAAGVGSVNTELVQIQFAVPIETQVNGADPSTGTTVTWGAIYDGTGALWAYGTVSSLEGNGDFKLQETLLLQGAFARLTSIVVEG